LAAKALKGKLSSRQRCALWDCLLLVALIFIKKSKGQDDAGRRRNERHAGHGYARCC
jgi:hypothetical protein